MKALRHAAGAESALFFSFEFIICAPSRRVDARISPRRNNRSFNSDAGSLSLSPVKRRPARFRHRSRRTFILLLVSRGARFIIAEAMICKISPPRSFDFRWASRAQAARRLSSVRIKLPFYYPWGARSRARARTPPLPLPFHPSFGTPAKIRYSM